MKTGNTGDSTNTVDIEAIASMEPGHEDREYVGCETSTHASHEPQWSPVMKTGNTPEYDGDAERAEDGPQWSPVMKTGNT